jgi:hypothetical protein
MPKTQMIRVSQEACNALKRIKDDTGITIGKLIEKYAIPALIDKFYSEQKEKSIANIGERE